MNSQVELVVDSKTLMGGNPCWEEETQTFYWVDLMGSKVYTYQPATGERHWLEVNQHVGAYISPAGWWGGNCAPKRPLPFGATNERSGARLYSRSLGEPLHQWEM